MADETATKIRLSYSGGIADAGRLHLYEFSRASYGYSRMLQTIEFYRREGRIAKRITGSANTDIIVSSPTKGSFAFESMVLVSGNVIPVLASIPFDVLVSYIIDILKFKRKSASDDIVELAKIRAAEEKARMDRDKKTEEERTKQLKSVEEIVKSGNSTVSQALYLTNWALKSNNPSIARSGIDQNSLQSAVNDIESDVYRNQKLAGYENELARIPRDDLAQLASRIRPMVSEIGLPLRKSADVISFFSGDEEKAFGRFDEEQIEALESRSVDEQETNIEASLKSYDRENGTGKLREYQIGGIHTFVIPINRRRDMAPKIAKAFQRKLSVFIGNIVRDSAGNMTSFILNDVLAADGNHD